MLIGNLALVAASLFTGAAFYINFAEQPALLQLDDENLLRQWKHVYHRGYAIQASLAIVGFILGLAAWYNTRDIRFLLGGIFMVANWPWTLFAIMPVNKVLMATAPEGADEQTRARLVQWNNLHVVRTALGGLAVITFLSGLGAP